MFLNLVYYMKVNFCNGEKNNILSFFSSWCLCFYVMYLTNICLALTWSVTSEYFSYMHYLYTQEFFPSNPFIGQFGIFYSSKESVARACFVFFLASINNHSFRCLCPLHTLWFFQFSSICEWKWRRHSRLVFKTRKLQKTNAR